MDNLFFLLFLFSFICLIIGLISPKTVIRWGNKKTRYRAFVTYSLAMIIFFILFGVTVSNKNGKGQISKETTASEVQIPKEQQDTSLGITPEEFKKRFNQIAKKYDYNFYIPNITVTNGPVSNPFSVVLNENIYLVGGVDKNNGKILFLAIIGKCGEELMPCFADMFCVEITLIETVDPELPPEQRSEVILNLTDKLKDKLKEKKEDKNKVIVGNFKYFLTYSEYFGFIFGIDSAKAKSE